MVRKVENPFKEQRIPSWIRYVAVGLTGCFMGWFLFGGRGGSSVDNGVLSSSRPPNIRLRPVYLKDKDDDMGENQNDDYIENEGGVDETDDPYNGDEKKERRAYENDDGDSGDSGDDNQFPVLEQDEYLDWIRSYYDKLEFEATPVRHKLTKPMLDESLRLGCNFIAANQKEETGNFNYEYDFVEKKMNTNDSPVRQAGALWGITLCFQSQPNNALYRSAVELGIAFFRDHMIDGPVPGSSMIEYPDVEKSDMGVNALYGLALIDYIRTIRDNDIPEGDDPEEGTTISDLEDQLAKTIRFLKYMQNDDLHFSQAFIFAGETKSRESSPYFDGETLLCLVKAAKYMEGYGDSLIPIIEAAAPVLAKSYTVDVWRNDEHDSDQTKGFYQWSSMVFAEYYSAEWEDYEYYGDLVLVLAHWIVHTHRILNRNANTGYAFEGIISAFRIAKKRGHKEALADLAYTIDEGLYELGSWQVSGPLAHTNNFLVRNPTDEKIAVGGVMNARDLAPLRIDTTQHQMHAVMMALETLFVNE